MIFHGEGEQIRYAINTPTHSRTIASEWCEFECDVAHPYSVTKRILK